LIRPEAHDARGCRYGRFAGGRAGVRGGGAGRYSIITLLTIAIGRPGEV
jgi:hypothetical protein